jgi:hypothetical protein
MWQVLRKESEVSMRLGGLLTPILLLMAGSAAAQSSSVEDIKRAIIEQSLRDFSGMECPCPYSTTWNSRPCAGKSIYEQSGSVRPLCYMNDVSFYMVEEYRRRVLR